MTAHPQIVSVMLGAAAGLTVLSCAAMAWMRSVYQRLHFVGPVVSVSVFLVATAVWVSEPEIQAGLKATLCALILFVMNGVLSHATARAVRVKHKGRWAVEPDDIHPPEDKQKAAGK